MIPGQLPQAWQLPRGVPIPDTQFSFLGGGDDGVVDVLGLSSIFQGIGSPSYKDDQVTEILKSAAKLILLNLYSYSWLRFCRS